MTVGTSRATAITEPTSADGASGLVVEVTGHGVIPVVPDIAAVSAAAVSVARELL
ncbi:MAG: hypothetical protein ACRC35_09840 [Angustibacter sp.]